MESPKSNIPLEAFNTFGLKVNARYYFTIDSKDKIPSAYSWAKRHEQEVLVLGGGSNILFISNFEGVILHNGIKGIVLNKEDDTSIYLNVGGGEVWDDFVAYCVEKGYGGVENLSLIPGTVGAAPIQNIGAYGVEVKDIIQSVEVYNIQEEKFVTFSNTSCDFGYRDSYFKRNRGQFFISSVCFRLSKPHKHKMNISYGPLKEKFEEQEATITSIRDEVIRIRSSKLPDPKEVGNAGSFFKNPIIPNSLHSELRVNYPTIPSYFVDEGHVKIPAGWLIDQLGWKGFKDGDIGVYPKQALVLVNYGGGTGKGVLELSSKIIDSVSEEYDILLEREVNIVGKQ